MRKRYELKPEYRDFMTMICKEKEIPFPYIYTSSSSKYNKSSYKSKVGYTFAYYDNGVFQRAEICLDGNLGQDEWDVLLHEFAHYIDYYQRYDSCHDKTFALILKELIERSDRPYSLKDEYKWVARYL